MIRVTLKNSRAETADGMRYWANYLRDEVAKKVKGMEKLSHEGSEVRYKLSDTIASYQIELDVQSFEVSFTLKALDSKGQETSSIPVGALVILMVFLYLLPTRARAGGMVPISAHIGEKQYDRNSQEQVKAAYKSLKNLLPEAWYVPYAEGIMDAHEYFAKRNPR